LEINTEKEEIKKKQNESFEKVSKWVQLK
jgi:hypothetical protein